MKNLFASPIKADPVEAVHEPTLSEKDGEAGLNGQEPPHDPAHPDSHSDTESEGISKDAQAGVQKAEATTSAWTRRDLILAYVLYVKSTLLRILVADH